mmetsp:Transcript_22239/g.70250  ORF Transcript_22239/g.70250 Transcript_22239/m.70250 type:complete len:454 (-) Transcript_22239:670-2031(-)
MDRERAWQTLEKKCLVLTSSGMLSPRGAFLTQAFARHPERCGDFCAVRGRLVSGRVAAWAIPGLGMCSCCSELAATVAIVGALLARTGPPGPSGVKLSVLAVSAGSAAPGAEATRSFPELPETLAQLSVGTDPLAPPRLQPLGRAPRASCRAGGPDIGRVRRHLRDCSSGEPSLLSPAPNALADCAWTSLWKVFTSFIAKGCFGPKMTIASAKPSRNVPNTHKPCCAGTHHCESAVAACRKQSKQHSRNTGPPPGASSCGKGRPQHGQVRFRCRAWLAMPGPTLSLSASMLSLSASSARATAAVRLTGAWAATALHATASSSRNSGHGQRRTLATKSVCATAASTAAPGLPPQPPELSTLASRRRPATAPRPTARPGPAAGATRPPAARTAALPHRLPAEVDAPRHDPKPVLSSQEPCLLSAAPLDAQREPNTASTAARAAFAAFSTSSWLPA